MQGSHFRLKFDNLSYSCFPLRMVLQEEWKRKIKAAGGDIHPRLKKGMCLFGCHLILNRLTTSEAWLQYC